MCESITSLYLSKEFKIFHFFEKISSTKKIYRFRFIINQIIKSTNNDPRKSLLITIISSPDVLHKIRIFFIDNQSKGFRTAKNREF